jgi:hypothetical protein
MNTNETRTAHHDRNTRSLKALLIAIEFLGNCLIQND